VAIIETYWRIEVNGHGRKLWTDYLVRQEIKDVLKALAWISEHDTYAPKIARLAEVLKKQRVDLTPVAPSQPTERDGIPPWVLGWKLARSRNDFRLWPEQKPGYLELGYAWDDETVMPQEDRVRFMQEAGVDL